MKQISEKIKLILSLSKTHSIIIKRFDSGMGNGIGFNEFLILFYLDQAKEKKLRRIDLAEKIEMTASGITRILLPMEKIGLIKNDSDTKDARVRLVSISASGRQKFEEALERLNFLFDDVLANKKASEIKALSDMLRQIGGEILMS